MNSQGCPPESSLTRRRSASLKPGAERESIKQGGAAWEPSLPQLGRAHGVAVNGNRKLHTSGRYISGGADVLPLMPVGRFGLDAGSGATGVLAKTRREAAQPAVTLRLPHAVRPTLS